MVCNTVMLMLISRVWLPVLLLARVLTCRVWFLSPRFLLTWCLPVGFSSPWCEECSAGESWLLLQQPHIHHYCQSCTYTCSPQRRCRYEADICTCIYTHLCSIPRLEMWSERSTTWTEVKHKKKSYKAKPHTAYPDSLCSFTPQQYGNDYNFPYWPFNPLNGRPFQCIFSWGDG